MLTLASAQLESAKIKASQAIAEFKEFRDSVIVNDAAFDIKQSIKATASDYLDKLVEVIDFAVTDKKEETEIHHAITDALISWQTELGEQIKNNQSLGEYGKVFAEAIKPKKIISVSQCAEKYRYLETGTNLPGPWRNENAPHLIEIMDSLSIHSPVQRVTFKKSSGISGTEIWLNWLLYIIVHAKKDVMLVVPDEKMLKKTFNPKIKKLLKETPILNELNEQRTIKDKDNEDILEIGNIRLVKSIATSPSSFRAEHLAYAITDEKSAMPWDVGGEGSVGELTDNRLKTNTRRKKLDISSPTQDGNCQISDDFEEGSQEYRHIYCPDCGFCHPLVFANFTWTLKTTKTEGEKIVDEAYFKCPECNNSIKETIKNELLDNATWIAKFPERKKTHRSFHINSFYIKFGLGYTWKEIAQKWLNAQKDSSKLTTFTNTILGETTKEDEQIDPNSLLTRLETFPDNMPDVIRTAGVDVQGNRLEYTLVDFEETKECWVQEHVIIPGDPVKSEVWVLLDESLKKNKVDFVFIDTGYLADEVHKFCESVDIYNPIKGMNGLNRSLILEKKERAKMFRARKKKGRFVDIVGIEAGKSLIHARLKFENTTTYDIDKKTGEILGINRTSNPGYIHFKNDVSFDDKYFQQLLAEKLTTVWRSGRKIQAWVNPKKRRNEALDCLNYANAAFEMALQLGYKFHQIDSNDEQIKTNAPQILKRKRRRR